MLAKALVAANGTVDPNFSKGVSTASVSHPVAGLYCFSGLGFTVKNGVATPDFALGFLAHSRPDATGQWTRLKKGLYRFRSDAHAKALQGSFKVA